MRAKIYSRTAVVVAVFLFYLNESTANNGNSLCEDCCEKKKLCTEIPDCNTENGHEDCAKNCYYRYCNKRTAAEATGLCNCSENQTDTGDIERCKQTCDKTNFCLENPDCDYPSNARCQSNYFYGTCKDRNLTNTTNKTDGYCTSIQCLN